MLRLRALTLFLLTVLFHISIAQITLQPCNSSYAHRKELQDQLISMFDHAFEAYMSNAFPADELRPLSCTPDYNFGNLTLTLVDSLDTFVVMGQYQRFADAVKYLSQNLSFDINATVSVFETTIRALGGLLSAHGLLTEGTLDTGFDPSVWCPSYDGKFLRLAVDLAERLMPAFETATGIPFGSVHLQHGVMENESRIASTAGAGSLLMEFGTLTMYTGDAKYYNKAFAAMKALHKRASNIGLVGNHINIDTGYWVASEAGVGGLVDSFYEYMLKGYILFGDERLLTMFRESYKAIRTYLYKKPWYLDADMWTGQTSSLRYSSLAAFWPGVQVLYGDVADAIETTRAHYAVWRKYGCLPEGYHVVDEVPYPGQINYPLRPELVESVFYLHWATNDSRWIGVANSMMHSIEAITRVNCGYAAVRNTATHELEDIMPSFLLSETFKYIYLVFSSEDENGKLHWLRSGKYVFTTEAHPFRIATDDIRRILGEEFDKEQDDTVGEAIDRPISLSWRAHKAITKCNREPRVEKMQSCGGDMPGSDFPMLGKLSLLSHRSTNELTEEISTSVAAELRRRAEDEGSHDVEIGEVIFGDGWACRIVSVQGNVVTFGRLSAFEISLVLQQQALEQALKDRREALERNRCRRRSGIDAVLGDLVCRQRVTSRVKRASQDLNGTDR